MPEKILWENALVCGATAPLLEIWVEEAPDRYELWATLGCGTDVLSWAPRADPHNPH